jgi:hypothetical protein
MSGHYTGPTSRDEPRPSVVERVAAERIANSSSRPFGQPATIRAAPARLLGRRLHAQFQARAAAPRPAATLTQNTPVTSIPSADLAPVEAKRLPAPPPLFFETHPLLQVLNRAGRLTFDALLLIVFAPVIAIWWLSEKRHKR